MSFLFGSSRRDQVHLLSTLQSLHATSVAGLSAALSWSERKTERVLRDVVGQVGTSVQYDAARRTVRIVRASRGTDLPVAVSGGAMVEPTAPPAAVPAPALTNGPILPKEFGGAGRCPRCQVPLLAAATGDAAVCPKCGQMSTRRVRPAATVIPAAAEPTRASSSPAAPVAENGRTVVESGDRRSQELFAAWVTSRPIPCPRCRSTLQHRGVGEYGCPSCGHRVAFETNLPAGTGRGPASPVAVGPTR